MFLWSMQIVLCLILLTTSRSDALTFREQCLKWHNYYRSIHQVGKVNWTSSLQKEAENWAEYLAKNNKAEHESGKPSSDNLWLSGLYPAEPCTEATKAFYAEEKYYDYNKPAWSWKAGHFTQLVWKSTKEIGAAQRVRKDKYLVVVIKYFPAGNINAPGYYRANVFPARYPTNGNTTTVAMPLCNITVVISNATNSTNTTATVIGVCPTTPRVPVVKAGSWSHKFSIVLGVVCLLVEHLARCFI